MSFICRGFDPPANPQNVSSTILYITLYAFMFLRISDFLTLDIQALIFYIGINFVSDLVFPALCFVMVLYFICFQKLILVYSALWMIFLLWYYFCYVYDFSTPSFFFVMVLPCFLCCQKGEISIRKGNFFLQIEEVFLWTKALCNL